MSGDTGWNEAFASDPQLPSAEEYFDRWQAVEQQRQREWKEHQAALAATNSELADRKELAETDARAITSLSRQVDSLKAELAEVKRERDFPDIGPDPLKLPDAEWREAATEESTVKRVRDIACVQQKGVPDQTALVWRIDLSRLLAKYAWRKAQGEAFQRCMEDKRKLEADLTAAHAVTEGLRQENRDLKAQALHLKRTITSEAEERRIETCKWSEELEGWKLSNKTYCNQSRALGKLRAMVAQNLCVQFSHLTDERLFEELESAVNKQSVIDFSQIQATTCGKCGQFKHTPWRDDAFGFGYVCATCLTDITNEQIQIARSAQQGDGQTDGREEPTT